LNCEWDLFSSIYFVMAILGHLASHKDLYIYFVAGHLTEFSLQLK
jgi:hypothetical protein